MNFLRNSGISVVWIDHEHARLFHLSDEGMTREELRSSLFSEPNGPSKLYDEVAHRVAPSKQILILGPGLAKNHLLGRLKTHFPLLERRVVGCEQSDHPNDHQIASYARKYFQKPVA